MGNETKSRRHTLNSPALEAVENLIGVIRGQKVMLDSDLAGLYDVDTKILNKAVRRNASRFPLDFMFQLTREEVANLRFQIGTSNKGYGGRRYRPYAFAEQGVAMLSSVLNSERAVQACSSSGYGRATPKGRGKIKLVIPAKRLVIPALP